MNVKTHRIVLAIGSFLSFNLSNFIHCFRAAPDVAIVGAGIGGSSTAYFLRKLYGDGVDIDVYEENTRPGGRVASAKINNQDYETGGSIIHNRNKYMVEFAKLLGLEHLGSRGDARFGIYNGEEYVFKAGDYSWLNTAKLFWRYGLSLIYWQRMIPEMLDSFDKIYDQQNMDGLAFTSVQNLLASMSPDFVTQARKTAKQHFEEMGFSERFIDELFQAITRVNYGQTTDINGFVGSVALAGAGSDLWSVNGGNRLVPEKLLNISDVNLKLATQITKIVLEKRRFVVHSIHNNNPTEKSYDYVIIAVPLIDKVSDIKFENCPTQIHNFEGRYHRTVSTLVAGTPNYKNLNLEDNELSSILVTDPKHLFNSLSRIYPTNSTSILGEETGDEEFTSGVGASSTSVWKVFSQRALTDDKLKWLFADIKEVTVNDWLAYPHYNPPDTLGPFVLHPGLYYTSAIEWAASAMEMSCIAGRNAALLVYNYWFDKLDKIDRVARFQRQEL